jgi:hypothetical protein
VHRLISGRHTAVGDLGWIPAISGSRTQHGVLTPGKHPSSASRVTIFLRAFSAGLLVKWTSGVPLRFTPGCYPGAPSVLKTPRPYPIIMKPRAALRNHVPYIAYFPGNYLRKGHSAFCVLFLDDFVSVSCVIIFVDFALFFVSCLSVRTVAEWLVLRQPAHTDPDRFLLRFDFKRPLGRFQHLAHMG